MFGLFTGAATALSFGDKIVNWYENSLIKELLDYFGEKYFSVDLGTYENFSVSPALGGTLRNVILALAAAFIVAAFLTAHTRVNIGAFVRRLISEGCLSPESAKTLMELGYFRSTTIRRELSRGGALGMVVHRCEATEAVADASDGSVNDVETPTEGDASGDAEGRVEAAESTPVPANNTTRMRTNAEKIDFMSAKFYIPEDLRDRAEIRFNPKGSGWRTAIIVSVLAVVVATALCLFTPMLIQLADLIMTWLAP